MDAATALTPSLERTAPSTTPVSDIPHALDVYSDIQHCD